VRILGGVPTCIYYSLLCYYNFEPLEEVDKDFELHDSFSDLDAFYKSIWGNVTDTPFTLDITALRINTVNHWITPLPLEMHHNGLRPGRFVFQDGPGFRALVSTILDNTADGEPVQLGVWTSGGMHFDMPAEWAFSFDHEILRGILGDTGEPPTLRPQFF
jgi:hypothetical protein